MSLLIYTIADERRAAPAINLMKAIRAALGEPGATEVGILDFGMTAIQQDQARAAGFVGTVEKDPSLQWPDAGQEVFRQKYRPTSIEAWRHVDRFLYIDSDVVLTRDGLQKWIDIALNNHGFTGVRQPSSWFHLFRGHSINDDQGLGLKLYDPIICASMWAATRATLVDLEAAMVADLVVAKARNWIHWADEAALNRILADPAFIQSNAIHALAPTAFWMGGFGFIVLTADAIRERDITRECPAGAGILCTPSGDPVDVLHFGEPDAADALRLADPTRLIPYPYLGRSGGWFPKVV